VHNMVSPSIFEEHELISCASIELLFVFPIRAKRGIHLPDFGFELLNNVVPVVVLERNIET
jgi:hypothetical protein